MIEGGRALILYYSGWKWPWVQVPVPAKSESSFRVWEQKNSVEEEYIKGNSFVQEVKQCM